MTKLPFSWRVIQLWLRVKHFFKPDTRSAFEKTQALRHALKDYPADRSVHKIYEVCDEFDEICRKEERNG